MKLIKESMWLIMVSMVLEELGTLVCVSTSKEN
jgi:hypothetical protein